MKRQAPEIVKRNSDKFEIRSPLMIPIGQQIFLAFVSEIVLTTELFFQSYSFFFFCCLILRLPRVQTVGKKTHFKTQQFSLFVLSYSW